MTATKSILFVFAAIAKMGQRLRTNQARSNWVNRAVSDQANFLSEEDPGPLLLQAYVSYFLPSRGKNCWPEQFMDDKSHAENPGSGG